MNRLGEDAFAGTALSHEQDGGVVGVGSFARDFEHAARGFVLSDHLAEIVPAARLFHVVAHAHA